MASEAADFNCDTDWGDFVQKGTKTRRHPQLKGCRGGAID
jgi:hypothetical protein